MVAVLGGLGPLLAVQVYVEPPDAVNVADCPEQIAVLGELILTEAEELTVTVTTAVLVQAPLLPVTV